MRDHPHSETILNSVRYCFALNESAIVCLILQLDSSRSSKSAKRQVLSV